MNDSLYVKLEDHKEYRRAVQDINELLDNLDEKMSRLKEIKQKEESYIETWEEKAEEIREKVSNTSELLDANKPS